MNKAVWSVYFSRKHDTLIATLWERGTCGLEEQDDGLRAYFSGPNAEEVVLELMRELDGSGAREELGQAVQPPDAESDPILVGKHFYIGAAPDLPEGRVALAINTGNGFGTGRHETTQLCLSALERLLRPRDRVLDVGCGSGILSLAARLLEAGLVVSCDIFEGAVAAARENARTLVFAGSADAVASYSFDLVLANLTGAVLDRLAFDLKRVTRPNGWLVISGFLQEAPPRHYAPEQVLAQGEWLCWICRPEQIEAPVPAEAEDGLTHATDWWL